MNPTKIENWQCPICKTVYENKEGAIACSSLPTQEHRFKVGDTVYIEERYPEDPKKPFVSVTISEIHGFHRDTRPDAHKPQYLLAEAVRVGKDCLVGSPKMNCGGDIYRPAYEWEFYQLGDRYIGDTFITDDLIGDRYL